MGPAVDWTWPRKEALRSKTDKNVLSASVCETLCWAIVNKVDGLCPSRSAFLQAENSEYIHSSPICPILPIFAIYYHPRPDLCLFETSQMTLNTFTSGLLTFQYLPHSN